MSRQREATPRAKHIASPEHRKGDPILGQLNCGSAASQPYDMTEPINFGADAGDATTSPADGLASCSADGLGGGYDGPPTDPNRSLGVSFSLLSDAALEAEGLAETAAAAVVAGMQVWLRVPGPPGYTATSARVDTVLREPVRIGDLATAYSSSRACSCPGGRVRTCRARWRQGSDAVARSPGQPGSHPKRR